MQAMKALRFAAIVEVEDCQARGVVCIAKIGWSGKGIYIVPENTLSLSAVKYCCELVFIRF